MSSSASASATGSTVSKISGKTDPCWKYVMLANPPLTNNLKCNFCDFVSKAGICRAKYHISGTSTDVRACKKCPPTVKEEITNYLASKKAARKLVDDVDVTNLDSFGDDETELDALGEFDSRDGKKGKSKVPMSKKPRLKGPMDVFFKQDAEKAVKDRRLRQTSINEACKKELREIACQNIARWIYDAAIPFNAVNYPSFDVMVESIGQFGVGLKPPTEYELRVPLLNKEVLKVKAKMQLYEEEWAKHGCSIWLMVGQTKSKEL